MAHQLPDIVDAIFDHRRAWRGAGTGFNTGFKSWSLLIRTSLATFPEVKAPALPGAQKAPHHLPCHLPHPSLPTLPLHSLPPPTSHTGFLSVLHIQQACSSLRAFALATPSAWTTLPQISSQLTNSATSICCSDVTSSERPSLTSP